MRNVIIVFMLLPSFAWAGNSWIEKTFGIDLPQLTALGNLVAKRKKAPDLKTTATCEAYLAATHEAPFFLEAELIRSGYPAQYAQLHAISFIVGGVVSQGWGRLNENSLRHYFGLPTKHVERNILFNEDLDTDLERVSEAMALHELGHLDGEPLFKHVDELLELRPGILQLSESKREEIVRYYLLLRNLRFSDGQMQHLWASYGGRYIAYLKMQMYPNFERNPRFNNGISEPQLRIDYNSARAELIGGLAAMKKIFAGIEEQKNKIINVYPSSLNLQSLDYLKQQKTVLHAFGLLPLALRPELLPGV